MQEPLKFGAEARSPYLEEFGHPSHRIFGPIEGQELINGYGARQVHTKDLLVYDINHPNPQDPQNPLELYLLQSLVNVHEYQSTSPPEGVHDVFNLILQHPWLLDHAFKNEKGRESYEAQKKLYSVLFNHGLLQIAIDKHPEYFLSHAKPLQTLLEKCKTEQRTTQYIFLLYLVQTVYGHLQTSSLDPKTKEEILKVWSSTQTHSDFLTGAFEAWSKTNESLLKDKVDGAALIVGMFANSIEAHHPEKITSLHSKETLAMLFQLGEQLEVCKHESTMPVLAEQGLRWLKDYVAPNLEHSQQGILSSALDKWVEDSLGSVKSGNWEKVPNQPMVWKKGGAVVDLCCFQILEYPGKELRGKKTTLPKEVQQNPEYIALFGETTFEAFVKAGKLPGEYLYHFADSLGNRYELSYRSSTRTVTIERLITVKEKGKEIQKKFRFCIPKPSDEKQQGIGIELALTKSGLWIDVKDRKKGVAFLGVEGGKPEFRKRFDLEFDKKGCLKGAKHEGLVVVHDTANELSKTLSCLPEGQLIFLKPKGKKAITDIVFLDQHITLSRTSKSSPWKLHGEEHLDGAQWVMGEDRGAEANRLLRSLGANLEDIGFTVRKDHSTTLLLWPHQVTAANPHRLMTFNKEIHVLPPLKVTIDDNGRISSSAAGYLELAYLFAAKHQYVQAAAFLDKARHAKIETKEELEQLIKLNKFIETLPTSSARSALLKLKCLLNVRLILQEQTNRSHFDPEKWKDFLKSSQQITDTFKTYQTQLKHTPFPTKAEYFQRTDIDIALHGDELTELNRVSHEALEFMLTQEKRVDDLAPEAMKLSLEPASEGDVSSLLPILIQAKAHPLKRPEDLLKNLRLSEQCVIEHFFELHNLIVERKIPPRELQTLFGPIFEDDQAGTNLHERLSKSTEISLSKLSKVTNFLPSNYLDTARRMLLRVAARNIEPTAPAQQPINLKEVDRIKRKLPTGMFSYIIKNTKLALHLKDPKKIPDKEIIDALDEYAKRFIDPSDQGKSLTLEGVKEATKLPSASEYLKKKETVDLDLLQRSLASGEDLFGPTVSPMLQMALNNADLQKELHDKSKTLPADKFVELVETKTEINILTALREQEVSNRIGQLENKLANKQSGEFPEKDVLVHLTNVPKFLEGTDLALTPHPDFQLAPVWVHLPASTRSIQKANVEEMQVQIKPVMGSSADVEDIANGLKKKIEEKYTLTVNQLPVIVHQIDAQQKAMSECVTKTKADLLAHIKVHKDDPWVPKGVRHALLHASGGDEDIIHFLKQAYQSMELNDETTCTLMTRFLLEQAAHRILSGEVKKQMGILESLARQGTCHDNPEWVNTATSVRKLISRALKFDRYLDLNDGSLLNPRMNRKVLVTEAHRGIVLSEEQRYLVEQMVDHPTDWYELKVGLGKTSVVFPIVLMLLIEKGEFPVAIVKDELLQQNLDSLDRATRDVIERAGVEFTFRLNDPCSPATLQEQYYKLLQIEENRGYPITSISSIIAIDQKMQLLMEELAELGKDDTVKALLSGKIQGIDPVLLKSLQEFDALQKELYYLGKIRNKLSLLIIDEADDILNVVCENNVGRGDVTPLNVTIQQTMERMMVLVQESHHPTLIKFKNGLQLGQQAAFEPKWVQDTLLPCLVETMLQDPTYRAFVGDFSATDQKELVKHICTVFKKGETSEVEVPDKEVRSKLGALKHIIQGTLRIALQQNPGIDAGIKKSDGFQVGPQVSGQEKIGTVFGDEFDLVVNHYLFYGVQLPSRLANQNEHEGFVDRALLQMRDQHPEKYKEWIEAAQDIDLMTFINRPENYQMRLDFLRLQIFDEKRLRRFGRQIVINRQHIGYGRRLGGMTGTLDKDSMPDTLDRGIRTQTTQQVTAQVILEAGVLKTPTVEGLTSDSEQTVLDKIAACISDSSTTPVRAIINQGFDLKKGDAKSVVAYIRAKNPNKLFIYVNSNDRKFYLWAPDSDKPSQITKRKLDNRFLTQSFRDNACFYFSPPDTRGTDFKIPPGRGVTFVSPKCSMDDFVQSLGRMRQAADTHSLDFVVSNGVDKRIRGRCQERRQQLPAAAPLTYDLVVEDIDKQDDEGKKGKHLKCAIEELKGIVNTGSRNLIFGDPANLKSSPTYWDVQSIPLRIVDVLVSEALFKVAADPKEGWLEETKSVSLESDFHPSVLEDTSDNIGKIYEAEKQKIARLKQAINDIEHTTLPILKIDFSTLGSNAKPWMEKRLQVLHSTVEKMETDLKSSFNRFEQKFKVPDIYPKEMPTSGTNIPTAQAQVQEIQQVQQQQQQQQQQIQQLNLNPVAGRNDAAKKLPYSPKPASDGILANPVMSADAGGVNAADFFASLSTACRINFNVTDHCIDRLQLLDGFKGQLSLCRVLVKDDEISLIAHEDMKYLQSQHRDAIYSITNLDVCGTNLILDKVRDKSIETSFPDALLPKLVMAKWFLGMVDFTEQELIHLRAIQQIIHNSPDLIAKQKAYLERFGTPEQVKLANKRVFKN